MRVTTRRNSLIVGLLLIAASVIFMRGIGGAQAVRSGDSATVPKGQTVNSVLFTSGHNVSIAGTVNGDVFCFGQTVTISGTINGDVICAARQLTISGVVNGNVRVVGQTVQLSGSVSHSASVAAQNLTTAGSSKVGLDLLEASPNALINGSVGRDLALSGALATVNGSVGRDLSGSLNQLSFGAKTTIGGGVDYISANAADVTKGAHFAHPLKHRPVPVRTKQSQLFIFKFGGYLYMTIALTLVALVLILLLPSFFEVTRTATQGRLGRTSTYGLIGLFGLPMMSALLVVTVVGIPLAILIMLVWLVGLILTGPIAAYHLGNRLLESLNKQQPLAAMFVGTIIIMLLYGIPSFGFVALISVGVYGYGALLLTFTGRNHDVSGSPKKPKRFAKLGRKA